MTIQAPPGFRFLREQLAVPAAIFPDRVRRQLTITEAKGNGQLRIVLPATRLDWENLNRRIYPTKVMKKAIESPEFKAKMEGGFLICSGRDHPKTPYVPPTDGSHIITNAWIEKLQGESYLMNEWLTLNTTEGRNLRGLFEGGAAFGVSIRGFGRIEEGEDDDHGTLAEYMYIGTDGVGEPSAKLYAGHKVPHCRVVECITAEFKVLEDRVIVEKTHSQVTLESLKPMTEIAIGDPVKLVGFNDKATVSAIHDDDYVTVKWEDGSGESCVKVMKSETHEMRVGGTVCVKSKTEGKCKGRIIGIAGERYEVQLPSGNIEPYTRDQLEDFGKDVDGFKEHFVGSLVKFKGKSGMEEGELIMLGRDFAVVNVGGERREIPPSSIVSETRIAEDGTKTLHECACLEDDDEEKCECDVHSRERVELGVEGWKKLMKLRGATKFTKDGNSHVAWNNSGEEVGIWVDLLTGSELENVHYERIDAKSAEEWKGVMRNSYKAVTFEQDRNCIYAQDAMGRVVGIWNIEAVLGTKVNKTLVEIQNAYGDKKTALTGPGGDDGHLHSYDPTVIAGITGMGGEDLHTHVFNISQLETAPGGTDGHTHQLTEVYVSAEAVLKEQTTESYDPQSKSVANLVYAINKLCSRSAKTEATQKVVKKYAGKKHLEDLHWKTLEVLLSELKSDDFKYIHSVQVLSKEQVIEMAKQKRVQELGVQEPSADNSVVNKPDSGASVAHANELTVGTDVTLGNKKAKVTALDGETIKLTTDDKEDSSWPISKLKKDANGVYFVQTEAKEVKEGIVVGNVRVKSVDRPAGANYVIFTPEDPSQYLSLRNALTAQGGVSYFPVPEGQVAIILDPAINPLDLPYVRKEGVIRENVDAMISDLVTWFNATPREKVDEVNRIFSKYGVEPTSNLESMVTGLKGLKLDDLNGLHIEVAGKCAPWNHTSAAVQPGVPVPVDAASYEALKAMASKTLEENGKVSAMRLFMTVEEQLNKIYSQTILSSSIGMLDKLKNEMFGSSEGARTLKKPHNEGKIVDQVNSLSRMIKEAYTIAEGIDKLQISESDKSSLKNLIEYVTACEDLVSSGATMVESRKQEITKFLKDIRKTLVIEGSLKNLKDVLGVVEQSALMIHNLKATLEGTQTRVVTAMHLLEHLRVFQRREYNTLKKRADASIKVVEHLRTRMKLMVANTQGKAQVPTVIAEAVDKIVKTRPELGIFREELLLCSKSPEHAVQLAKKYMNVKSIETIQPLSESVVTERNVGSGERMLPAGLR